MNMNRAIVTAGMGLWYPRGIARMIMSVHEAHPDFQVCAWVNTLPPGSPAHANAPYAFKFHAINHIRRLGVEQILWLDAAVTVHHNLDEFFDQLRVKGHYFEYNGAVVGEWCADSALAPLGVTREEAFKLPELCGGCFALDFTHSRSVEFFDKMFHLASDGVTFPGPWDNRGNKASVDPRVKGHRHDQTAMSVISHRMGMEWQDPDHRLYVYPAYGEPKPEAIFYNRGM